VSRSWSRYYAAAGDDPRPTLLHALEHFEREPSGDRFAIDLGCGTGRDTAELLRRGWRVLAVDSQAEALEQLVARLEPGVDTGRLETLQSRFEDAAWPEADLVTSSFALPFCDPERFPSVWERITESLRPGGRFCGQLFGDRDEWAARPPEAFAGTSSPPAITFHTRAEVEDLLSGLEVEYLREIDEDGQTAVGDRKRWHHFHIVARKP
jgi:SAM-dependent methyltransferase